MLPQFKTTKRATNGINKLLRFLCENNGEIRNIEYSLGYNHRKMVTLKLHKIVIQLEQQKTHKII